MKLLLLSILVAAACLLDLYLTEKHDGNSQKKDSGR